MYVLEENVLVAQWHRRPLRRNNLFLKYS